MSHADARLLDALDRAAPGAVTVRASDRLAYAHDASHYLLVPRVVVTPRDAQAVGRLLRVSAEVGVPLTFRSGGTSLTGQATTQDVLVDVRRHFQGVDVLDDGLRVRVRPGTTVRAVNVRLAPYGRKLGPDPASEVACTIGGVIANNASGMACGTELNTYRTLESAVLVLPSGTVIDTGVPDADDRLRQLEPEVYAGLVRLRDRVRGNPDSVRRISKLFTIKNTMGYGVNSFVDHTSPIDILAHLVVGSEGTLAFVGEATFVTVPNHPEVATALLLFPDLAAATASLPALMQPDLATIELMDAASLRVAQQDPAVGGVLCDLIVRDHAALLIEHRQPTAELLAAHVEETAHRLGTLPLCSPAEFMVDAPSRAALWHARSGLYAAVAGARPSGTTALLEDVAVPVEKLLPLCQELTALFGTHGHEGSAIFGHAKHGNIHFLVNEDFERPEHLRRYLAFTNEMVDCVLSHGGTLKAEHGTGRMMAPFVRRQYGDELYDVMRELKRLLDPNGLLSPDVLLNEDPSAPIMHLKSTPAVETEVDHCVECGYCEPVCPSKDLTMTPRRRIALRRELARARRAGDQALADELEDGSRYEAVDTCAVDGLCQLACPLSINTADLTRRLRTGQHNRLESGAWTVAARHWDGTTRVIAQAMSVAASLPEHVPTAMTSIGRRLLGDDIVPTWSPDLPGGGTLRRERPSSQAVAVYFPSCLSTLFAPADDGIGVRDAFLALCDRAGVPVRVPSGIASMCCGTPWTSKGLHEGHDAMRLRVVPLLRTASNDGALPIVVDAASCTEGLRVLVADSDLQVIDAVDFVAASVLHRLPPPRRLASVVMHPTCASTRLGLDAALRSVAAALTDDVIVPTDWGCCAFAGDRGMLHPELTASATRGESRSVAMYDADRYVSVNRTCEIGMSRATNRPYRHLLELLEEQTR